MYADGIGEKKTAENRQDRSSFEIRLFLNEGGGSGDGRRGWEDRSAAESCCGTVIVRLLREGGPGEAENRLSI